MIPHASAQLALLLGVATSSLACVHGARSAPPAGLEQRADRGSSDPPEPGVDLAADSRDTRPRPTPFALATPSTPPPPHAEADAPDVGAQVSLQVGERPEVGPATAAPAPNAAADPPYATVGEVALSADVERRVAALADAFHRRTNKRLVLTSGARDPARQAEAMVEAMRLGADVVRLYRDKTAVREIRDAFESARAAGQTQREVLARVEAIIREQVARGVYASAHLRAGAVDVRSRGMTAAERAILVDAARAAGFSVLQETAPPHFHLQLDD